MRHSHLSTAVALLAASSWLAGCGTDDQQTASEKAGQAEKAASAPTARLVLAAPGAVQPVPMPNVPIPGYKFPEDSSTINKWVTSADSLAISRHGWGVWTALSSPTQEKLNGEPLRVYETWLSKAEVDAAQVMVKAQQSADKTAAAAPVRAAGSLKRMLQVPRQLLRDPRFTRRHAKAASPRLLLVAPRDSEQAVFESVSYDPTAANTIINGRLFWASTLQGQLNQGRAAIPEFENTSVAIKPVYEIVPGPTRSQGLYQMKVWTGPPRQPVVYDQPKWPASVYVDIKGRGQGHGQVSLGGRPATPATTYNLADFIHFTLTADDVKALGGGQVGDYAILVAMHITTKEIKEWTWQTMWWAPDPDKAPRPSRASVVQARPAQLTGAPRHYAMAIAYQMIAPAQPISGGTNVGQSMYVFNPYLEAGFSPSTFNEPAYVVTNGVRVLNNVGVRTNCMSCHIQATFTPVGANTNPGYIANTYIPLNSPKFKGNLRTDFLWSIADMASSAPDSAR